MLPNLTTMGESHLPGAGIRAGYHNENNGNGGNGNGEPAGDQLFSSSDWVLRPIRTQYWHPYRKDIYALAEWEWQVHDIIGDAQHLTTSIFLNVPQLKPIADFWLTLEEFSVNAQSTLGKTSCQAIFQSSPFGTPVFPFINQFGFWRDLMPDIWPNSEADWDCPTCNINTGDVTMSKLLVFLHQIVIFRDHRSVLGDVRLGVKIGINSSDVGQGLYMKGLVLVEPFTPYEPRKPIAR